MRLILSTLAVLAFVGPADACHRPFARLFHRHHACPAVQQATPCCPQTAAYSGPATGPESAYPAAPMPGYRTETLAQTGPAVLGTNPTTFQLAGPKVGGFLNHSRHGPLFDAFALAHAKKELIRRGVSPDDVERAIATIGGGRAVDAAFHTAKVPVGAIGDGTIIQAIVDWFKSPQGQALIAALIKVLLAALGI